MALPSVRVLLGGTAFQALVDTGCTQTIVARKLVGHVAPCLKGVLAVNGEVVKCGVSSVVLTICGKELHVQCLVLDSLLTHFDIVLGMDIIEKLGGVSVAQGKAEFGLAAVAEVANMDDKVRNVQLREKETVATKVSDLECNVRNCRILELDDTDFSAWFDGQKWTVRWKWAGEVPVLHNRVACYNIAADVQDDFDLEVKSWITEGILQLVPDGELVESLIPMMAVKQINKGKVRPVLDFRQLNRYVSSHPGASDVCDETLRKWRRVGDNIALLDLRKAYLQLHVDQTLWKHQVVEYQGNCYYLTRLGFGLNSAPKIMSLILAKVLSLDEQISVATDNYIDDILVNEDVVSTHTVTEHLDCYGLQTKPPEPICGAKVLGLHVEKKNGQLIWMRANKIPEIGGVVTRRELFSICGLLIGHYPVAGWLRVACGFIKRHSEGIRWEDNIGKRSRLLLLELAQSMGKEDPVGGSWPVTSFDGRLWCDASALSLGCALEVDGAIVEDGSWLRKKNDGAHINMAELDSVLRGLNLAVKWKMQKIELMTDSATVYGWLTSVFLESHKIKTKGMNEMLIKRRLSVVKEICDEYGLQVTVRWVESARNKSDVLTRVPRSWLEAVRVEEHSEEVCLVSVAHKVHALHHLGIDRTLYLARLEVPNISRKEVAEVVGSCQKCASIDPAPVLWEKGRLTAERTWDRVAVDVTHYNGRLYLTAVDCGPSRFAVWRQIRTEDAESISIEIEQTFREQGPPVELLMDNGAAFRSQKFRNLLRKWQVKAVYRCAYRPSGNGIVERNHRTIKRMASRTNSDPLDMVFYYNATPKDGTDAESVPSTQRYRNGWRIPKVMVVESETEGGGGSGGSGYGVGDAVFVKPRDSRCTSRWSMGTVTRENTSTNVEVDGMPRHVADIRPVPEEVEETEEDLEGDAGTIVNERRSQRERKPPDRFGNNIYDN
jgi:transposase InsO family protein/predicted aspartyl protease